MSRFVFPRLQWISHIYVVTMWSNAVTRAEIKVPAWIHNLNKQQNSIPDPLCFCFIYSCAFVFPTCKSVFLSS